MTKSFNKFKKPCFWPIFGPLSQILGSTTGYGFLATFKIYKKNNDKILRKCLDRRMDGRKEGQRDGQTLFYRALSAAAEGPITYTMLY